MTKDEFLQHTSNEIRYNEALLVGYVELFKNEFGREPNCVPCTFNSDYQRLKKQLTQNKSIIMAKDINQTFEVNPMHRSVIIRVNGVATYLINASDEQVLEYLKEGKGVDLDKRKSYFKTLPKLKDVESVKIFDKEYPLNEAIELIHAHVDTTAKTVKGLENALEKATKDELESLKEIV